MRGRPDTNLLPRIRPAGDSAITVEFADEISIEVNEAVHTLDEAIRDAGLPGIVETIPAYRSLLVVFDPVVTGSAAIAEAVLGISAGRASPRKEEHRRWLIPACFGGEFGADLMDIATRTGLAPDQVVRRHCDTEYRVYMIGFSPGFAYLGGLAPELRLPRRQDPRSSTPAGSIMQGGDQAAISPLAMPSGWHLLGRTPVKIFDLRRARPFLLAPGDRVRLQEIDPDTFERLAGEAERSPTAPESEPLR